MNELTIVDKFLYSVLGADAQLASVIGAKIYTDMAPRQATFPFVVFQLYTPRQDTRAINSAKIRVWSEIDYLIRGVDKTESYASLELIANRIDEVIDGRTGVSVPGGVVETCLRRFPFRYQEIQDGVQIRHMGGVYRFNAKAL